MKKCKYCKEDNESTKDFCCQNCYQLWRYHNIPEVRERVIKISYKNRKRRIKNSPKFRKEIKEYGDKWRKENKEKFNTSIRNSMRRRLKIKPENYKV